MITIVARIQIKDGYQQRFESIFARRRARSLAQEPGTLRYDLFSHAEQPLMYTVIEDFTDAAAHQAHLDASIDHHEIMACFACPPQIEVLQSVFAAAPQRQTGATS